MNYSPKTLCYVDVLNAVTNCDQGDTVILPEGEAVYDMQLRTQKTITFLGQGEKSVIINKTGKPYPITGQMITIKELTIK